MPYSGFRIDSLTIGSLLIVFTVQRNISQTLPDSVIYSLLSASTFSNVAAVYATYSNKTDINDGLPSFVQLVRGSTFSPSGCDSSCVGAIVGSILGVTVLGLIGIYQYRRLAQAKKKRALEIATAPTTNVYGIGFVEDPDDPNRSYARRVPYGDDSSVTTGSDDDMGGSAANRPEPWDVDSNSEDGTSFASPWSRFQQRNNANKNNKKNARGVRARDAPIIGSRSSDRAEPFFVDDDVLKKHVDDPSIFEVQSSAGEEETYEDDFYARSVGSDIITKSAPPPVIPPIPIGGPSFNRGPPPPRGSGAIPSRSVEPFNIYEVESASDVSSSIYAYDAANRRSNSSAAGGAPLSSPGGGHGMAAVSATTYDTLRINANDIYETQNASSSARPQMPQPVYRQAAEVLSPMGAPQTRSGAADAAHYRRAPAPKPTMVAVSDDNESFPVDISDVDEEPVVQQQQLPPRRTSPTGSDFASTLARDLGHEPRSLSNVASPPIGGPPRQPDANSNNTRGDVWSMLPQTSAPAAAPQKQQPIKSVVSLPLQLPGKSFEAPKTKSRGGPPGLPPKSPRRLVPQPPHPREELAPPQASARGTSPDAIIALPVDITDVEVFSNPPLSGRSYSRDQSQPHNAAAADEDVAMASARSGSEGGASSVQGMRTLPSQSSMRQPRSSSPVLPSGRSSLRGGPAVFDAAASSVAFDDDQPQPLQPSRSQSMHGGLNDQHEDVVSVSSFSVAAVTPAHDFDSTVHDVDVLQQRSSGYRARMPDYSATSMVEAASAERPPRAVLIPSTATNQSERAASFRTLSPTSIVSSSAQPVHVAAVDDDDDDLRDDQAAVVHVPRDPADDQPAVDMIYDVDEGRTRGTGRPRVVQQTRQAAQGNLVTVPVSAEDIVIPVEDVSPRNAESASRAEAAESDVVFIDV